MAKDSRNDGAQIKEALYSKKVNASGKTYYFDVKETAKGGKYFTVSESRKLPDGQWKRNSVIVFEEGVTDFIDGMNATVEEMLKTA